MTPEKFEKDLRLLAEFAECYCAGNCGDSPRHAVELALRYQDKDLDVKLAPYLCASCESLFLYAHERLQACPHEEKPRCRNCPHPCYERSRWKEMAKMMRYSGMRLGFSRLKNKLLSAFS